MRKLALSDEILMKVDKPARYIGNEFNSVMKDTSQVNIRFAMCFPDVYEIGMSHLGIQILYDMFNRMDDVWCERVYSPWPDLHEIMKQENIPLFGLESQEPIKDFDFVVRDVLHKYFADTRPRTDTASFKGQRGGLPYCDCRRSLYLQPGADCRLL